MRYAVGFKKISLSKKPGASKLEELGDCDSYLIEWRLMPREHGNMLLKLRP